MAQSKCIADYMTPSSHVARSEESLHATGARMHQLRIRHLPIVHEGVLRGVLTAREVGLARSLPRVDFDRLSVAAAMNRDVYPVTPSAPLEYVVRTMMAHGYGCAIIMDAGTVTGVFAMDDALRILAAQPGQSDGSRANGQEMLATLVAQHAYLEALLVRARSTVRHVQRTHDPERALHQASELTRHLLIAMKHHLELEERLMSPVLAERKEVDAVQAQAFGDEHRRRCAEIGAAVAVLDDGDLSSAAVAEQVENLVATFKRDLAGDASLLLHLNSSLTATRSC
jgi:CBS domain-containing protein